MIIHKSYLREPFKRPIRILLVADEVSPYLYDYYTPDKLKGIDLILAAGDLSAKYLEFLSSAANAPLYYVRGNHDDRLENAPPEGGECIEGRIVEYNGIRILGLGGSYRYRDGKNMYTERQMRWRIRRLFLRLYRTKGFDILLTHTSILGVGDIDNYTHRGFKCFGEFVHKWHPKYMIHGHAHMNYGTRVSRVCEFEGTQVINACGYYILEYTEPAYADRAIAEAGYR